MGYVFPRKNLHTVSKYIFVEYYVLREYFLSLNPDADILNVYLDITSVRDFCRALNPDRENSVMALYLSYKAQAELSVKYSKEKRAKYIESTKCLLASELHYFKYSENSKNYLPKKQGAVGQSRLS